MWWIPIPIALAVLGLYLFVSHAVYRRFILIGAENFTGLVDQESPFFKASWEWYKSVPRDTVKIRAFDGTRLTATAIAAVDANSGMTAILLHGYRSVNTDLAIIARLYSNLGFRVLLPDARAHGLSGGAFTSFGHHERHDLKKWIDYVLRTHGATEKILVHGVSMGASTALLAGAGDIPGNVRLIVADSPFTSVWSVFARSVKPKILALFLPGVEFWCRYQHRFFLFRLNVKKAVATSKVPFLIIHSVGDRICPYAASERLATSSPAPFKEVYAVHSDVHAEGYRTDKAGIDAKIAAVVKVQFADSKKK